MVEKSSMNITPTDVKGTGGVSTPMPTFSATVGKDYESKTFSAVKGGINRDASENRAKNPAYKRQKN